MHSQYDPSGIEQKWYERWRKADLFSPHANGDAAPFVITLPPPNVTGILHIGHCLGGVIMDSLVRYYRMRGRPALFVPGTDHASIATENKVAQLIESEGGHKRDLGREAFVERAWDWANQHHDRIISQLERYGMSLDWSREAFTMDEARNRAVLTAFKKLYDKGLIYRGDYMVNWSVAQQSAVSDEEVVYKEVHGKLWHLRYPLDDGGSLCVATTRPETMLGDTAVAIHPGDLKTAGYRGKSVRLPLTGRSIPIVEDEHVDPEFGSGCVKVTPAHDPNDYEIGKRHHLEFINILNPDGTLNDRVPEPYRGLDRFAARKKVVADLDALGLLEKVEEHVHNVGYHDRTDTIIEPYISTQWFMKMESLAQPALKAVEYGEIKMFPERWVGVYYHWLRNIKDWCISRQLWWGHRIPYYTCDSCDKGFVELETPTRCESCGATDLRQDPDVLDTWFSSWLWTFSPLGWPEATLDLRDFHPTSVLVTAADILFFWVTRMIMASFEFLGEKPFAEVIYTGLVRDAEGRKLSKSLGNSPDPMDLMDRYGADALRFVLVWLTPTGQDINFGDETVEQGRNFCNKIWNATRLLYSQLDGLGVDFPPADAAAMAREFLLDDDADAEQIFVALYEQSFGCALPDCEREPLGLEDRWMLHRACVAMKNYERAMESRRLNDAAHAAYDCFWHEFCDWYLEAIKTRLHGDDAAGKRTAVLTALCVHGQLLRLLHPFLPHITEELWSLHPQTAGFCMQAPMPRLLGEAPFAAEAELFDLGREIVQAARNLRNELGVPPGKRGMLRLASDGRRHGEIARLLPHVEALAKMEAVELVESLPSEQQAVSTVVADIEIQLPIAGLIDLAKERDRLGKERDGLAQRVAGVDKKLANANFTERAPAEVVDRERQRRAELAESLEKLEAQLRSLG